MYKAYINFYRSERTRDLSSFIRIFFGRYDNAETVFYFTTYSAYILTCCVDIRIMADVAVNYRDTVL